MVDHAVAEIRKTSQQNLAKVRSICKGLNCSIAEKVFKIKKTRNKDFFVGSDISRYWYIKI